MSKLSRALKSPNTAEQLTFFAAGFPASPPVLPENDSEPPIIAGSGLTFCAWCLKSNPCFCWRKILAESLHFALMECNSANGLRVSLRLEVTNCSPSSWLLKTLARRTGEKEFSSSGEAWIARLTWPTPAAANPNDGEDLATWLARRERLKETAKNGNGCGTPLAIAIQMWPTPTARDYKNVGNQESMERRRQDIAQPLPEVVINGQPDPDSLNTNGKSRAQLNYRWVAQLQGFPSDWLDGIE